uniref:Uncharacterized protein n=1 Tax=Arion vulgaris TaxID=1028688 RepID=A0A0B7AX59_9EUPU
MTQDTGDMESKPSNKNWPESTMSTPEFIASEQNKKKNNCHRFSVQQSRQEITVRGL